MIKFRIYLDKEAEEKWLNQMAADGWAMESFFGGFINFLPVKKERILIVLTLETNYFLLVRIIES